MKKLQILFAVAAIVVSAIGVFANGLVTPLYFQSTVAGAHCDDPLTVGLPTENCDGTAAQCSKIVQGDEGPETWYISKKADAEAPCVEVKRAE